MRFMPPFMPDRGRSSSNFVSDEDKIKVQQYKNKVTRVNYTPTTTITTTTTTSTTTINNNTYTNKINKQYERKKVRYCKPSFKHSCALTFNLSNTISPNLKSTSVTVTNVHG